MRVLSVDYGTARIGLALSDPTGTLAQGLSVLRRCSDAQAVQDIARVAAEHEVAEIVVGYPRNMDGSIGERARQCEAFATALREVTGLPVVLFDERLTTASAERLLISADVSRRKRKQVVDAVAATILLQNYLDTKGRGRVHEATSTDD